MWNSGEKLKFCPGVYRFRAWARATSDYDGVPMIMHARITGTGSRNFVFSEFDGDIAKAVGAFPRDPDTWQQIEVAIEV